MVLLLVAAPALASADPFNATSWYEAGVVHTRIETDAAHSVDGYAIRFSPRVTIAPHLYIGGELDTGSLDGRIPESQPIYRASTGGEMVPTAAVTGKLGAVRFVVGTRLRAGMFSAGAELALGIQSAELEDAYGRQVGVADSMSTMAEARGRIDLWLSPAFTIGGIAGVDVTHTQDVSAGLMLGLHWGAYDGMR